MELQLQHIIYIAAFAIIVCLSLFLRKVLKNVGLLTNTVQEISLKSGDGKRKRSMRKALKTIIKLGKMLINQKPEIFKDNAQLGNFNVILKNKEGKFDILKADGVIGDELMQALEDLGIDTLIEKFG